MITVFLRKLDHRPLFNYILRGYSSGRVDFNMNNKRHTAYIIHHVKLNNVKFQSLLFYTELNEVCGNYVWILKWVSFYCNWINLISILNFPKEWVVDYRGILRILQKFQDWLFYKTSQLLAIYYFLQNTWS